MFHTPLFTLIALTAHAHSTDVRVERPPTVVSEASRDTLADALDWLVAHQKENGSWPALGMGYLAESQRGDGRWTRETGARPPVNEVGVTALAVLALLGEDAAARAKPIARGVHWLSLRQDDATGLVGEHRGHTFLYNHGIATLALCEFYAATGSPLVETVAQKAVDYVLRARNPYGAWRYDVPPVGDNDTSITGWMVSALSSAESAGLRVDGEAFTGALKWIDEVTDPESGRVGYDAVGSRSSRVVGANEHMPPERGEAMTAVGLTCRALRGQTPAGRPVMEKHGRLLLANLPEWDPQSFSCDMYYWYFGTRAAAYLGGRTWEAWDAALRKAAVTHQRRDGDMLGSWDPIGPWGYAGGRVYATALMALALEVPAPAIEKR